MQPVGKLPLQSWMKASPSRTIITALTAQGGIARFVGGCVRDAVVDRPISDIDIATTDTPDKVIQLLAEHRVVPVGASHSHGSVLAVVEGVPFHVTTLRADVETFGRHARVTFVDDWREDAKRRDLTLNALYMDLDGTLYDPCGGLADLKQGRIRFIGEAKDRIREDYLRVLRFFRFQAYYGLQPPEESALQACCNSRANLPTLSGERVWYELRRLLVAPDPVPVLKLMWQCQVLDALFPYLKIDDTTFRGLSRLILLENKLKIEPEPLRRLACLVQGNRIVADEMRKNLRFSKQERKRLQTLTRILRDPPNIDDRKTMHRLLYCFGADLYRDIALILADQQINVPIAEAPEWLQRHLDYAEHWWSPTLPLKGSDIIELGIPPGPRVSELLAELEDWWLDNSCRPSREKCLSWLRAKITP